MLKANPNPDILNFSVVELSFSLIEHAVTPDSTYEVKNHKADYFKLQDSIYVKYWILLSSRFDLIFLMLDPRDEAYDRRLARHLVSLYYQSEERMEEEYMDMAVLRDYIAYARCYVNPRLSEEASQALIEVK